MGGEANVEFGVLGDYDADPRNKDPFYGLYLQLCGRPVVVDIRRDRYVEQRKAKALQLYVSSTALEASLIAFLQANPTFTARTLSAIGLHSKNLDQGEVFWDPNGYTLLRGLSFELE